MTLRIARVLEMEITSAPSVFIEWTGRFCLYIVWREGDGWELVRG